MPSTDRNPKRTPTPRQLHYLRDLAMQTGTSFEYPHTFGKARSEIRRLIALKGQLAARRIENDPHDLILPDTPYELAPYADLYGQVVDFEYVPDHAYAA